MGPRFNKRQARGDEQEVMEQNTELGMSKTLIMKICVHLRSLDKECFNHH